MIKKYLICMYFDIDIKFNLILKLITIVATNKIFTLGFNNKLNNKHSEN